MTHPAHICVTLLHDVFAVVSSNVGMILCCYTQPFCLTCESTTLHLLEWLFKIYVLTVQVLLEIFHALTVWSRLLSSVSCSLSCTSASAFWSSVWQSLNIVHSHHLLFLLHWDTFQFPWILSGEPEISDASVIPWSGCHPSINIWIETTVGLYSHSKLISPLPPSWYGR